MVHSETGYVLKFKMISNVSRNISGPQPWQEAAGNM